MIKPSLCIVFSHIQHQREQLITPSANPVCLTTERPTTEPNAEPKNIEPVNTHSINAVPESTQQPTTELMNIDPADTHSINDVPLTTVGSTTTLPDTAPLRSSDLQTHPSNGTKKYHSQNGNASLSTESTV